MSVKQQLANLRYSDNLIEAFEAARELSNPKPAPIKEIIAVLKEAKNVHNREAAAWALSRLYDRRNQEPLAALLAVVENADETPAIRAQCLEGFANHQPSRKHRLWSSIEQAVLAALSDKSVEVRFWACFAAGQMKMKSALPKLHEMMKNDTVICPGWWRVSEEAADAIEWIYGRETEPRKQMKIEAKEQNDG